MLHIEQIYTGCLSQATYYIESNGEAAVIDPLRDIHIYIEKAKKNNVTIKYIFETHFHADFVSGHIDLANQTDATIVYGPTTMQVGFKALIAHDNQKFKIGDSTIQLLHTPGHTMESACYLLLDEQGKQKALFSGDTLFIGDVGRPDLAQHVIAELTQEKLAAHLFDSLRTKIMPLSDDIIVYPAHGAGSACGKNMSKETSGTLELQKKNNYALQPNLTKDEFIKQLLSGLMPPPGYFPQNVLLNIQGYNSIDSIVQKGAKELSIDEFEVLATELDALIIDTRYTEDYIKGFIPNSINIGLNGALAVWAGTLIPSTKQAIVLITEEGKEEESIIRLARVGYDNTLGYLKGGYNTWKNASRTIDTITTIEANKLAQLIKKETIHILDVRKKSEYESEHIRCAINVPLDYINENIASIDPSKTYYVHCAAGYRSVIFISILKARGFNNLININGGFAALKASKHFHITDYVCPTTML